MLLLLTCNSLIATQEFGGNPCSIGTRNWRHPDQWPISSIMQIKLNIRMKTDAILRNWGKNNVIKTSSLSDVASKRSRADCATRTLEIKHRDDIYRWFHIKVRNKIWTRESSSEHAITRRACGQAARLRAAAAPGLPAARRLRAAPGTRVGRNANQTESEASSV